MREVFQTHYNILCRLRLEILASHLVAAEIINTDDHESIRAATNTSDKSAIILRAISSHLDVDYTDSFTLLLDLMYQYGDVVMKKLAGEINQKLNSTSPGKRYLPTTTHFMACLFIRCTLVLHIFP